ncbi:Branched-chain amino acid transport system ATP-binding protein OS=Castellaniella defragrans OX=75697 GN=HNR28_000087 PE=4 SV=1 [Castellaniella defragrans]
MGDLLNLQHMSKRFGGLLAVDDLSLDVGAGEIHALIGPNGAGKSTIINTITGIYKPSSGSIQFDGNDIGAKNPEDISLLGVARTFQTIRIWKGMTLLENVMVGFQSTTSSGFLDALLLTPHYFRDEAKTRNIARECLALVGLGDQPGRLAGALSYGQQRLLEVARAMATQPRLLLLDEPAAGMNPQETNFLSELFLEINRGGVTLLIVEHNMNLIMRLAHRITVVNFGKRIADGAPEAIQTNSEVIAAYLGGEGGTTEN